MKTFECLCGATLFFDNVQCVACGRAVGFCPGCRQISQLVPDSAGQRCGWDHCQRRLVKCANYSVHNVCNRCVTDNGDSSAGEQQLCDYCSFNATIPDLSVAGNQQRWYRLELAKRRLLYTIELLQLPYGTAVSRPQLSFAFLGDTLPRNGWRPERDGGRIFTGYLDGRITINIREADSLEREKARVELNEPRRTLIGHFRHEIGHYFWDVLVAGRREDDFSAVFGDHRAVRYEEAQERHYQNGPPADWRTKFVSAYASMHPSEDFAETFGAFLDMVSLLDTAHHMQLGDYATPLTGGFDSMLSSYGKLGVAVNEINRDMGLLDAVPHVFVESVVKKLKFVHEVCP